VKFVKGHGTRNDFVVVPDLDDTLNLTDAEIAALCDRRGGIGADGILRLVRGDGAAPWFMDYRNADGSVAEMCGNGIRVLARYLLASGLQPAGTFAIDTRAGVRIVRADDGGDIAVDMGRAEKLPDAKVALGDTWVPAVGWSMGNPHLVVTDLAVDGADLTRTPQVDPADAYPDGVNVEIVEAVGPRHLRMRVHERGVGETQSCGTGACAAAVAVMAGAGERGTYDVDVPGGRLRVTWRDDGSVELAGPAVLVAQGEYQRDSVG